MTSALDKIRYVVFSDICEQTNAPETQQGAMSSSPHATQTSLEMTAVPSVLTGLFEELDVRSLIMRNLCPFCRKTWHPLSKLTSALDKSRYVVFSDICKETDAPRGSSSQEAKVSLDENDPALASLDISDASGTSDSQKDSLLSHKLSAIDEESSVSSSGSSDSDFEYDIDDMLVLFQNEVTRFKDFEEENQGTFVIR